jgi:hypothetical protein
MTASGFVHLRRVDAQPDKLPSPGSYEWPAIDGDFVAELADFDVADDEDGFDGTERTEIFISVSVSSVSSVFSCSILL